MKEQTIDISAAQQIDELDKLLGESEGSKLTILLNGEFSKEKLDIICKKLNDKNIQLDTLVIGDHFSYPNDKLSENTQFIKLAQKAEGFTIRCETNDLPGVLNKSLVESSNIQHLRILTGNITSEAIRNIKKPLESLELKCRGVKLDEKAPEEICAAIGDILGNIKKLGIYYLTISKESAIKLVAKVKDKQDIIIDIDREGVDVFELVELRKSIKGNKIHLNSFDVREYNKVNKLISLFLEANPNAKSIIFKPREKASEEQLDNIIITDLFKELTKATNITEVTFESITLHSPALFSFKQLAKANHITKLDLGYNILRDVAVGSIKIDLLTEYLKQATNLEEFTLSSFLSEKQLDTIIQAASEAKQANPKLKIRIDGIENLVDQGYRKKLEGKVAEFNGRGEKPVLQPSTTLSTPKPNRGRLGLSTLNIHLGDLDFHGITSNDRFSKAFYLPIGQSASKYDSYDIKLDGKSTYEELENISKIVRFQMAFHKDMNIDTPKIRIEFTNLFEVVDIKDRNIFDIPELTEIIKQAGDNVIIPYGKSSSPFQQQVKIQYEDYKNKQSTPSISTNGNNEVTQPVSSTDEGHKEGAKAPENLVQNEIDAANSSTHKPAETTTNQSSNTPTAKAILTEDKQVTVNGNQINVTFKEGTDIEAVNFPELIKSINKESVSIQVTGETTVSKINQLYEKISLLPKDIEITLYFDVNITDSKTIETEEFKTFFATNKDRISALAIKNSISAKFIGESLVNENNALQQIVALNVQADEAGVSALSNALTKNTSLTTFTIRSNSWDNITEEDKEKQYKILMKGLESNKTLKFLSTNILLSRPKDEVLESLSKHNSTLEIRPHTYGNNSEQEVKNESLEEFNKRSISVKSGNGMQTNLPQQPVNLPTSTPAQSQSSGDTTNKVLKFTNKLLCVDTLPTQKGKFSYKVITEQEGKPTGNLATFLLATMAYSLATKIQKGMETDSVFKEKMSKILENDENQNTAISNIIRSLNSIEFSGEKIKSAKVYNVGMKHGASFADTMASLLYSILHGWETFKDWINNNPTVIINDETKFVEDLTKKRPQGEGKAGISALDEFIDKAAKACGVNQTSQISK